MIYIYIMKIKQASVSPKTCFSTTWLIRTPSYYLLSRNTVTDELLKSWKNVWVKKVCGLRECVKN